MVMDLCNNKMDYTLIGFCRIVWSILSVLISLLNYRTVLFRTLHYYGGHHSIGLPTFYVMALYCMLFSELGWPTPRHFDQGIPSNFQTGLAFLTLAES